MFQSKKWKEENSYLKSEIISLTLSLESVKEEKRNLLQKLESAQSKKSNERGAGRKSAMTSEQISMVLDLLNQQKKVSEIVFILNQSTNRQWSRSTVDYLMKKHLVQNMEGIWEVADQ